MAEVATGDSGLSEMARATPPCFTARCRHSATRLTVPEMLMPMTRAPSIYSAGRWREKSVALMAVHLTPDRAWKAGRAESPAR